MKKKLRIFFVFCILYSLLGCSNKIPKKTLTLSKLEILVSNVWVVEEVMSNYSCQNLHYKKGNINTTGHDYSPYKLVFNSDGTGSFTNGYGVRNSTTWRFISPDEHDMQLIVNSIPAAVYEWNMVEISKNSFQQITVMKIGDNNILQSTRYIPEKR